MKTFYRITENLLGGRSFLIFESYLEAAVETFMQNHYPDRHYNMEGFHKIIVEPNKKEYFIYRIIPAGKIAELEE